MKLILSFIQYAIPLFFYSLSTFSLELGSSNLDADSSSAEFEKGFSEQSGIKSSEKEKLSEDFLKIGGMYKNEIAEYHISGQNFTNWILNPQTVYLYFDSRLKNDARLFLKGRMVYDGSIDETQNSPLTGLSQKRSISNIDELKLQMQLEHQIFITLGTQKIKWGTGHFWNPTDFLNSDKRDFLQTTDSRAGLSLLKIHLPIKNNNFYFIQNFEKATTNQSIGTALRSEFSFLKSEISLTRYQRKEISSLSGADLSIGLGDFDFIAEGSLSDDGKANSSVIGTNYQLQYSETDSIIFSYEYFWNEQGAKDKSAYIGMIANHFWVPFQVAQRYELFSAFIPTPGSWNKSNFQFFIIHNLIDFSQYYRSHFEWSGLENIVFEFNFGVKDGTPDSEMKLGGLFFDWSTAVTVSF